MFTGSRLFAFLTVTSAALISSTNGSPEDHTIKKEYPPICSSQIYCYGGLLHDVQLAEIFKDSKTFVDLKLKVPEEEILAEYGVLKERSGGNLTKGQISQFVDEHFEHGHELEKFSPPDFRENPKILERIRDPYYQRWASELNMLWRTLSRKVKTDVRDHPHLYSLIYVPNGLVVPGGRFKEIYYWDTYWIVYGLLTCEMEKTAEGIIENLLTLVQKFGYIPNGSRRYYLKRSQPPMLIPMADAYLKFNRDAALKFIAKYFEIFETEFLYWIIHKMVAVTKNGKTYYLAHYTTRSKGPRPESYKEDFELAAHFLEQRQRDVFYNQIKTAAETGWDFSSRHINYNGENIGNLTHTLTESIIQVDLNCILEGNARTLSKWASLLNNLDKSLVYKKYADNLLTGITEILWNEEEGIWFDYDALNKKQRKYFYASNFAPLWSRSYRKDPDIIGDLAVKYLSKSGVIDGKGNPIFWGLPTSLINSTQQWDYPNLWSPLQSFLILGLDQTKNDQAQVVARKFAEKFARTNYAGYSKTGKMFEKYSALYEGESGKGGEYDPQDGFGWSNGVIFQILERFGHLLSSSFNANQDDRVDDNKIESSDYSVK